MKPKVNQAVFILLAALLGLGAAVSPAAANNLGLENVRLTGYDDVNDLYDLEFDISWENSWLDAGAPGPAANWDAAWLFAKFSVYDGSNWGDWAHCTLLNAGSSAPAGSQFTFADNQGDGVYRGAFIYRSASGSGSNNWDNAQIRWDYGADGVADGALVQVKLFAIEMVHIPGGSFYVGDTDCDNTGNIMHNAGCSGAVQISAAPTAALCTEANGYDSGVECAGGNSTGTFCIDGDGGFDLSCDGIENPDFPTGYGAFYLMKYEISQGQYADFLNTLTRAQQNTRTASQSAGQYVMSNTALVNYRSGLRAPAVIPSGAITFGCDLEGITAHNTSAGDGVFNESNDGQDVAANYLSWMDGAAYLDWAALRPFTELEFEKAARGPQPAVDDEYAWGDAALEAAATTLLGSGQAGEVPNQGNMNYSSVSPDGPFRVGSFADGSSSRANAGAGYYGVMELSGNLWERTVTVGNAAGQAFSGTHGDGVLSSDGYGTNSDWPGQSAGKITGATGSGFRGGTWDDAATYARVAARAVAAASNANRFDDNGFRGARTSP
jgi:formylglycine-generating enzyme required for sulfatase activity